MKFKSLEELLSYIYNEIMQSDYEKLISFNYSEEEIIMFVFESEIPIKIKWENIYHPNESAPTREIICGVFPELINRNTELLGEGWLKELDEICVAIDENKEIFEKILKKGK